MHIRTVLGNIGPEELGITLGYEHLLIDLRGLWDNPPIERAYLIDQKPTLENRGELMRNPYDSRPNLLIECVLLLLEKGYGSQIMLAHDICTCIQFRQYGGWSWDHLLSNIVPRLRYAGVSQQQLDVMFIETPRRLLTFTE
jgi:predicted metal-dependent phosphotriesterase family hydrolase